MYGLDELREKLVAQDLDIDDRIIDAGSYKIDAEKLRAVGRMSGYDYTRTRDRFALVRP